jgi:hypothetical protein
VQTRAKFGKTAQCVRATPLRRAGNVGLNCWNRRASLAPVRWAAPCLVAFCPPRPCARRSAADNCPRKDHCFIRLAYGHKTRTLTAICSSSLSAASVTVLFTSSMAAMRAPICRTGPQLLRVLQGVALGVGSALLVWLAVPGTSSDLSTDSFLAPSTVVRRGRGDDAAPVGSSGRGAPAVCPEILTAPGHWRETKITDVTSGWFTAIAHESPTVGYRWEPSAAFMSAGCAFSHYWENPPALQSRMLGRFVLLVGDSVDHAMFLVLCARLGGKDELHKPLFGYTSCPGVAGGTTLVHTLICGSHDGPYFRDCKSRFHSDGEWTLNMTGHVQQMRTALVAAVGRPPDLVSVHFGVWDLASKWQLGEMKPETWFDGYPDGWVASTSSALGRFAAAFPAARIVFRVIGPTVQSRFKDPNAQQRLQMRFVASIASASRRMCADGGWYCVDFFSMMLGMDTATWDGMHWDGGLMAASYFNTLLNAVWQA